MKHYLLLLRHAKSAWDTGAASDFERPLAPRGERDAPRMGAWLAVRPELQPDCIIASPAERARETASLVAEALGQDPTHILWEPAVYGASPGELLSVVNQASEKTRNLMLVGHNPGMELLVRTLCRDVRLPHGGKLMPTAALAIIEIAGSYAELEPEGGVFKDIIRPKDL